MSSAEEKVAPFLTVSEVIAKPMSSLSAMFFVYGMYLVLFVFTVRILYGQLGQPNRKLYFGWTIALFVLATIRIIIDAWSTPRQSIIEFRAATTKDYQPLLQYWRHDRMKTIHVWVSIGIFHANVHLIKSKRDSDHRSGAPQISRYAVSFTAEMMVIHRCYTIWNSMKRVGISLFVFSILLNGAGLTAASMNIIGGFNFEKTRGSNIRGVSGPIRTIYFFTNVTFNGCLTIMTAGRIWYLSRKARHFVGPEVNRRYRRIIAIVLESGPIYPIAQIVETIQGLRYHPESDGYLPIDVEVLAALAAGIAPTLIIARAATGSAIESHKEEPEVASVLQLAPRSMVNITSGTNMDDEQELGLILDVGHKKKSGL
ncbi:hypothetical protein AAF712_011813 [Marasmius tenuissimus]|uniref:Uncharacterized protein n=1 Tax=Marasmius tenuissimus TaxID=585030 RepID=A0ABR2ZJD9_9AGAR